MDEQENYYEALAEAEKILSSYKAELQRHSNAREYTQSITESKFAYQNETVGIEELVNDAEDVIENIDNFNIPADYSSQTEIQTVLERAKTLMGAVMEMYEKQQNEQFSIDICNITANYDEAECDGNCLAEDIGYWISEFKQLQEEQEREEEEQEEQEEEMER